MQAYGAFFAFGLLIRVADSCSNFYMRYTNPDFKISIRTMDVAALDAKNWIARSVPRGTQADFMKASWTSQYGYIGFTPKDSRWSPPGIKSSEHVFEGLNERGLSCAILYLAGSQCEPQDPLHPEGNVPVEALCKWSLEKFESVMGVKQAMANVSFPCLSDSLHVHYVVQDAQGQSLVIEFTPEGRRLYDDPNDGKTGFGIMTNEPPFDWQLENVRHFEWKRTLARSSAAMPGNFYPDERFLRIHLVKTGLERASQPATYREAVADAVSVLNTVTVPLGSIPGTDTEPADEMGDHTQWGIVRDHRRPKIYVRSETNPSFRLIDLEKLDFNPGADAMTLEIEQDPWFLDVTDRFQRSDLVV